MATPPPESLVRQRGRFAGWALAYAFMIAYVSVVLGPVGFNFVPLDPETAWHMLLATPYLETDSTQRPIGWRIF